jgi:hypothetical protein
MVAILQRISGKPTYICGGTLVTADKVLTGKLKLIKINCRKISAYKTIDIKTG